MLDENVRRARLHEDVLDAGLCEAVRLTQILRVARDREDRNVAHARQLLQRAAELEPVHTAQHEIGNDGVGTELLCLRERLVTVVCVDDTEAGMREEISVHEARAEIVLDDQHKR